ncbi:MAG TPA: DUF1232 domain-containing protein [Limnochordales bacterium]
MRCQACGQEVVLARRCPYCGRPTGVQAGAARPAGDGRGARPATGRFVGAIGRAHDGGASGWRAAEGPGFGVIFGPGVAGSAPGAAPAQARLSPLEWARRLAAFVVDGQVASWKKALLAAGLLYLLAPFDLVADLLPVAGWVDDLLVLWWGLRALTRELARYTPPGAGAARGPGADGETQRS